MRVVVVGASGNVGTALLRRFADDGTGTSGGGVARRGPPGGPPAPHPPPPRGAGGARRVPRGVPRAPSEVARGVACDVGEGGATDALAAAFAGADGVVQLGWAIQPSHDRRRLRDVNVAGTRRVLAAARRAGVP